MEYFMDGMQDYEVGTIIENIAYTDVNDWEQTRLNIFTTSKAVGSKIKNVKETFKLPWDEAEETEEKPKTTISNEEISELQELANKIKKEYYGQ